MSLSSVKIAVDENMDNHNNKVSAGLMPEEEPKKNSKVGITTKEALQAIMDAPEGSRIFEEFTKEITR